MIKRHFILAVMVLLSFCTKAQKIIQMEKDGGVYKISCSVNGARMKMIFDTGASAVSLSMSMANYLYENDYIKKEDIIGSGKSQTADGTIVDHIVINLRDIEISGLHIKNIKATVIDGQNAPLLLGQTAIQALGPVTISGKRLIINNSANSTLSEGEINQIRIKAESHYKELSFFAAIECYEKIRNNLSLNVNDYMYFIPSCISVGQYNKALELVTEWENGKLFLGTEEWMKSFFYGFARTAYDNLNDFRSAVIYLEKEIACKQANRQKITGYDYSTYASVCEKAQEEQMAIVFVIKAIRQYLLDGGYTIADIYNGKITDDFIKEEVGYNLALYASLVAKRNNYYTTDLEKYIWMGSAMCGYQSAIDWCSKFHINYKTGFNIKYNDLFVVAF